MKVTNLFRVAAASILVIGIAFLVAPAGEAATGTISSSVTIAIPVTVTPGSDMDFGLLIKPDPGDPPDVWILDPCSGTLGGGTPGRDPIPGDEVPGGFDIHGEPHVDVSYTFAVLPPNFGVPDLTLSSVQSCVPSPQNLGGGGIVSLVVGATLTVGSNVPSGTQSATIELTANY